MNILRRNNLKLLFTIFCSLVVAFMAGYWYFKYEVEDKSVGVVDYISLKEIEDIQLPDASLCFQNPFLKKRFNVLRPWINETTYLGYLNGDIQGDDVKNIDYDNVTLDLDDYLNGAFELWNNETDYRDISSSSSHATTFNGFIDSIKKCFSINTEERQHIDIKQLTAIVQQDKALK